MVLLLFRSLASSTAMDAPTEALLLISAISVTTSPVQSQMLITVINIK